MIGVYFSGTGNTKYCLERFLKYYNDNKLYSIEDKNCIKEIKENSYIALAYPIYYSDLPIIVRNFIVDNKEIFKNKNIFIIVTMGLFSGDGAGCSARLLKEYGASIIGGLHLKMPDCIGDVKALKKSLEENKTIVKKADIKIKETVENLKNEHYFYKKTYRLKDKLKIDYEKCISCGKCLNLCPMKNIELIDTKPAPQNKCTCCYRCISNCPKQAITLIGNEVFEQCTIEKYIDNNTH